jgi:hypothetical protein
MQEACRAPGSEWLKNHPRLLEAAYQFSKRLIVVVYPLLRQVSPRVTERLQGPNRSCTSRLRNYCPATAYIPQPCGCATLRTACWPERRCTPVAMALCPG